MGDGQDRGAEDAHLPATRRTHDLDGSHIALAVVAAHQEVPAQFRQGDVDHPLGQGVELGLGQKPELVGVQDPGQQPRQK